MTKTNYLLCPGDACPLRFTCMRWQKWLSNDGDESDEMDPDYHDGGCTKFIRKEYYYGG